MTNKSINLIRNIEGKDKSEKEAIIKEVIDIEFKKIKAQAKLNFKSHNVHIENIAKIENSEELYEYLMKLSVVDICLISSIGVDVNFINMIKV